MGKKLLFAGKPGNLDPVAVAMGLKGVKGATTVGGTTVMTKGEKSFLMGGGADSGAESLSKWLSPIPFGDAIPIVERSIHAYRHGTLTMREFTEYLNGDERYLMKVQERISCYWKVDRNLEIVGEKKYGFRKYANSITHTISTNTTSVTYPADHSKNYQTAENYDFYSIPGYANTLIENHVYLENGDTRSGGISITNAPSTEWNFEEQDRKKVTFLSSSGGKAPFHQTITSAFAHSFSNSSAQRVTYLGKDQWSIAVSGHEGGQWRETHNVPLPDDVFVLITRSDNRFVFWSDRNPDGACVIFCKPTIHDIWQSRHQYGFVGWVFQDYYPEYVGIATERQYIALASMHTATTGLDEAGMKADYKAEVDRFRKFLKSSSDKVIADLRNGVIPELWEAMHGLSRRPWYVLSPIETIVDGNNLGIFPHEDLFRGVDPGQVSFRRVGNLIVNNFPGGSRIWSWEDVGAEYPFPYKTSVRKSGFNVLLRHG